MTGTAVTRHTASVETLPAATAMDVLKKHPSPITKYLVEQQALIEPLLPDGVRFLSVVWEVVAALTKDQQNGGALARCTPDSVFLAVTRIQAWGLEIGRTAHLVPFGQVCTPLIDYKGDIQLAVDARVITHAKTVCVYAGEEFQYEEGLTPILRHVPSLAAQKPENMLGAYAILTLPTREKIPHWMPIGAIDTIRQQHSKQWKKGPVPDWYAKKTVIRQALKTVPKTSRTQALLARLEQVEAMEIPRATEISATMAGAPGFEQTEGGTTIDTATGVVIDPPSLAEANALPFPFHQGKPIHGRPLGELPTDLLTKVAHWIVEQQDTTGDPQFHLETLNAINVIVDARENPPAQAEPPAANEPPDLGFDDAPKGAPAGSLRHDVPKPGAVQDAFDLNEPKRTGRDALREG